MSEVDIEQLIGEVARKHDVLLSRDDPILVSVTLNEQILNHALAQLQGNLEQATQKISALSANQTEVAKTIAEQLITAAAGYVADEVRAAVADIHANTDGLTPPSSEREGVRANHFGWVAAGIAISAACISGAVAIAGPIFLETQSAYADCRLAKP